ncbi:MAG: hypothetical protein ABIA04_02220 [Pseudomonadota bacterium]
MRKLIIICIFLSFTFANASTMPDQLQIKKEAVLKEISDLLQTLNYNYYDVIIREEIRQSRGEYLNSPEVSTRNILVIGRLFELKFELEERFNRIIMDDIEFETPEELERFLDQGLERVRDILQLGDIKRLTPPGKVPFRKEIRSNPAYCEDLDRARDFKKTYEYLQASRAWYVPEGAIIENAEMFLSAGSKGAFEAAFVYMSLYGGDYGLLFLESRVINRSFSSDAILVPYLEAMLKSERRYEAKTKRLLTLYSKGGEALRVLIAKELTNPKYRSPQALEVLILNPHPNSHELAFQRYRALLTGEYIEMVGSDDSLKRELIDDLLDNGIQSESYKVRKLSFIMLFIFECCENEVLEELEEAYEIENNSETKQFIKELMSVLSHMGQANKKRELIDLYLSVLKGSELLEKIKQSADGELDKLTHPDDMNLPYEEAALMQIKDKLNSELKDLEIQIKIEVVKHVENYGLEFKGDISKISVYQETRIHDLIFVASFVESTINEIEFSLTDQDTLRRQLGKAQYLVEFVRELRDLQLFHAFDLELYTDFQLQEYERRYSLSKVKANKEMLMFEQRIGFPKRSEARPAKSDLARIIGISERGIFDSPRGAYALEGLFGSTKQPDYSQVKAGRVNVKEDPVRRRSSGRIKGKLKK